MKELQEVYGPKAKNIDLWKYMVVRDSKDKIILYQAKVC